MLTQQLLLAGCVPVLVLQWLGSAKQDVAGQVWLIRKGINEAM
jgi:hypothetical protein